jgi:DNA-binding NarL/FixJ family response regulator
MTSILIADDQQLVRTGLRMILDAEPDLDVVGEAVDGVEAVACARDLRPDVVLMDVQMPRLDGIAATGRVLADATKSGAGTRVVVLTTFSRSEIVYEALVAGASGFLLKDMPEVQLVGGIRAVARGEELLAPALTRRLVEQFVAWGRQSRPNGFERLTEREREVFLLVARGLSNAEIAADLVVSLDTVKTHVSRCLDKLGLRDRVQAVILAYETGLVRRTPEL